MAGIDEVNIVCLLNLVAKRIHCQDLKIYGNVYTVTLFTHSKKFTECLNAFNAHLMQIPQKTLRLCVTGDPTKYFANKTSKNASSVIMFTKCHCQIFCFLSFGILLLFSISFGMHIVHQ